MGHVTRLEYALLKAVRNALASDKAPFLCGVCLEPRESGTVLDYTKCTYVGQQRAVLVLLI